MPSLSKYANAVIYKLISANDPNLIYYGSTTQTLEARLALHVSDARPHTKRWCSSRHVINAGAYSIHELQKAPCASKKELLAIERLYIEGRDCVNVEVPGRTEKEYKKTYYQANAETIKKQSKAYYHANADAQKALKNARTAWRRSFGCWAHNEYGTLCDIHPTLFN